MSYHFGKRALPIVTDSLWIDFRPNSYSGTTVYDQSGNGRNATLYNGASVSTTPTGETAFYTDGVNDAIHYRITSASQKPSTGFPFTGEAWLYRDDSSTIAGKNAQFGKPHNSRNRFFDFQIYQSTAVSSLNRAFFSQFYTNMVTSGDNDYLGAYQGDFNSMVTLQSDYSTTNQTWYHCATVWYEDGAGKLTLDFYVNGVKVLNGVQTTAATPYYATNAAWPWEGTVSTTYPMSWGFGYRERYSVADTYDEGYSGDFRMYTKALTQSEIQQNFNATKSNYGY